jgi:hypothetical protein
LWHTLDGGINNYTLSWTSVPYLYSQGRINQTAWDAAPYGDVTIRFYAEDTAGNIGYNEVIIKKITGQEIIPGFYLLIFISMMGILTALYLKKKYKPLFF